jgi:hypothetical protein
VHFLSLLVDGTRGTIYRNSSTLDFDLARRMRAAGVPLDVGAFAEAMVIRQEGGPFANLIALSYPRAQQVVTIIICCITL